MEPAQHTNLSTLKVYEKAKFLASDCLKYFYKLKFNRHDFLILQLLRAITSVGANIAEGYGRHYTKNYRQFLAIARGSCYEVEFWLDVAMELKKYDNVLLQSFTARNLETIKILTVMKSLERRTQS